MPGLIYNSFIRTAALAALAAAPGCAMAQQMLQGSITTQAGTQFCADPAYPAQFVWGPGARAPASAKSGTPRIEQYRAGTLLATYSSFNDNTATCSYKDDGTDWKNPAFAAARGCGPFTRSHADRLWAPGDVFLVYPAVYTGSTNAPWFGPGMDSTRSNGPTPMTDITIQGVIVNNTRPVIALTGGDPGNALGQGVVYFDVSDRLKWSDIDVISTPSAVFTGGKAGVYDNAASNLRFQRSRVMGFENVYANGFFGAGNYTGSLTLTEVELGFNGQDSNGSGPGHNAYIVGSLTDTHFTVILKHSWSHDGYYGHLFKTRAQRNIVIGNYFQGGLPQKGYAQAEGYLLDVPNGGVLTAYNNIFVKNSSGANSNGMSIAYDEEGTTDAAPQTLPPSIDIESNSFVAFASTYDGTHAMFPMAFGTMQAYPGGPGWSGTPYVIQGNLFGGYCPIGNGPRDYRGDYSVVAGMSEIDHDFVGPAYQFPGADGAVGVHRYTHVTRRGKQMTYNKVGSQ